jgi:hypothetical protein
MNLRLLNEELLPVENPLASGPMSLFEIAAHPHCCRWPVGDDLWCARPALGRRPFCLEHTRMAYRRPPDVEALLGQYLAEEEDLSKDRSAHARF